MSFQLQDCTQWLGDNALNLTADATCTAIAIDSRVIQPQQLFAACVGEQTDGNQYIDMAMTRGAAGVLTEALPQQHVPTLQVRNIEAAIDAIAQARRRAFAGKVIGITGSVGKTSTKNACAHMLAHSGVRLMATDGNYNNQLGVPLTLTRLDAHDIALIELGISHPGDMMPIAQMAQPHISVIANVAPAHSAHFDSLADIAEEKGCVIDCTATNGIVILNRDDAFYDSWRARAGSRQVISVGHEQDADVRITTQAEKTLVVCGDEQFDIQPATLGAGAIWASAYAVAVAMACDMPLALTAQRARKVPATPGRMECIAHGGMTIIHDSYNANPASMNAALDATVRHATQHQQVPLFILGDMNELGRESATHHRAVGDWLNHHAPQSSKLWTVGSQAATIAHTYRGISQQFVSVDALVNALQTSTHTPPANALILLKASRACGLEKVLPLLTRCSTATHSTVSEET